MANFIENLKAYKDAVSTAATLTVTNAEILADLEKVSTENISLDAQVADLLAKNDALTKERDEAKAAQNEFDAKVKSAASAMSLEIIGQAGAKRIPNLPAPDAAKMSRAEFTKMDSYAQMQFCKNGGKIIE